MTTRLVLPWPPSANTHWRSVTIGKRHAVLLSAAGRDYRSAACAIVRKLLAGECQLYAVRYGVERLSVSLTLCPPDRRKRDIDNSVKPTLDALTHAGLWSDDEQIDELLVRRAEIIKGGRVVVEIREIKGE